MTHEPDDLPSPEKTRQWSPQLDSIQQKERELSATLHNLANHADELLDEMMQFMERLSQTEPEKNDALAQQVAPEISLNSVADDALEMSEQRLKPNDILKAPPSVDSAQLETITFEGNFKTDVPDATSTVLAGSASWLDKELAQRGADVNEAQWENLQLEKPVAEASPSLLQLPELENDSAVEPTEGLANESDGPENQEEPEAMKEQSPAMSQGDRKLYGLNSLPERDLDYERLEMNLGIKWLGRIGIVAILVGLTMALCYSFPHFSSEMKLLTGAILALGFFGGGSKLHQGAPILGRLLQGGGLALGYLSLFGMFFIPAVQLINSSILGYLLLFGYTVSVMGLSHQLKSQTTAILALVFGYYTAGYAANYEVAFISTAILMLGNAGLIRQHPDWQVATKANLLGGLWTYGHWCQVANLQNEVAAQLYLGYTYTLFHLISLLRAGKGDVILNVLNTFACYILFKWTNPALAASAVPEFIIGVTQLSSLAWAYQVRPAERDGQLPYSLLLLGLTFSGLGIGRYFSPELTTAVTAGLALCLASLGKKGVYTRVMNIAAYFLIVWAGWNLILHWNTLTDAEAIWNGLSLVVSSFILEATAFRSHDPALRSVLLVYTSLLFFCEILSAMPVHYRTISFVLSGFVWLSSGLITRRKLHRILGLAWIFLIGGFSLLGDFFYLETIYRILLFILLGVGLLGGSYGYVLLERRLSDDCQEPGNAEMVPIPVVEEA